MITNEIPWEVWQNFIKSPHLTDHMTGFLVIAARPQNPNFTTAWSANPLNLILSMAGQAVDVAVVAYCNAYGATPDEALAVVMGYAVDARVGNRNLRGQG